MPSECTRAGPARGRHDERDWCTRTATLRPGLGSQRDLPVDPGGLAPSVALRHLPHADQRVRPGPQHQLLQVPDLRPVPLPRRLEDPLPQPPYVLLAGTPVNGVPLQHVLRSVHRHRRLTCPSVPAVTELLVFNGSPAHVSALSRPGTRPGIRPVIRGHPAEEPVMLPRFPAAFRPPAFASWASCPARGFRPSYDRPTAPPSARTRTGFPCSARVRPGWGGCPLYPGGGGVHATVPRSAVAACRFPAASPCHPGLATRPGELELTGHQQGFTGVRPSSLPLTCGPGTEPAPLGFPLKLRTPAGRTRKRTSRAGTGLEH